MYPERRWYQFRFILPLTLIYSVLLILSNVTASKLTQIGNLHFTVGIIFFPFTYILSDIITEVYGFQISRKVIWSGLACNILFILGAKLAVLIPSSSEWTGQLHFDFVFSLSERIFIASVLAYIVGEFTNSYLVARLKLATKGAYMGTRFLSSTIVAALLDTSIFSFISFYGIIDTEIIFGMIFTEYFIKIAVELFVLPASCNLSRYLQKAEDKESS